MDTISAVDRAVAITGGQSALARLVGVQQPHVHKWVRSQRIPAERVLPIYRATRGAVTPHQMRPDIYPDPDWLPPLDVEDATTPDSRTAPRQQQPRCDA